MIRSTKIFQFIVQCVWNGWRKNRIRFPEYVLVRIRTNNKPDQKQDHRSR